MLFFSFTIEPSNCSFCGRSRKESESKIELFGYKHSEKLPAICDQCLIDCISKAKNRELKITKSTKNLACDFCSEPISEYGSYYTKGEDGICVDCISKMVSIILEVGMEAGIKHF